MSRKTQRPPLQLIPEEIQRLEKLTQSQTAPHREVCRARILIYYMSGKEITKIAKMIRTTRRIVYKCIDRALAMGINKALADSPNRGVKAKILPEDKAWVLHLACSKPKELGYAAELWTRKSLAEHVRKIALFLY